jgi:glycogen phosphorylase
MKAAINGALNLSILDGWWDEGYTSDRGWSIGSGEEYSDHAYQDAVEAQALYNLLENDVIPCFYNRVSGNMPVRVARQNESLHENGHGRIIAAIAWSTITSSVFTFLRSSATRSLWPRMPWKPTLEHPAPAAQGSVERDSGGIPGTRSRGAFPGGRQLQGQHDRVLGRLAPEEVDVELYYGRMKRTAELSKGLTQEMAMVEDRGVPAPTCIAARSPARIPAATGLPCAWCPGPMIGFASRGLGHDKKRVAEVGILSNSSVFRS